jgi:plasmid maintenance system antidote protein VapI
VRLDRYFGNRVQFRLDLWSQYDIAMIEREQGSEIARRVFVENNNGRGPCQGALTWPARRLGGY